MGLCGDRPGFVRRERENSNGSPAVSVHDPELSTDLEPSVCLCPSACVLVCYLGRSGSSTRITSKEHGGLNAWRHDQSPLMKKKIKNSINVIHPSTSIRRVSKYHVFNGRLTL